MGKIYYIMGKSASGKDHIYEKILSRRSGRIKPLVLYTTRPVRSGEEQGKQYFFVNADTLEELEKNGKVIERRDYLTVNGIWSYFTVDDGRIDLENEEYLGIGTLESYEKLKNYFGKHKLCPIYIEVEDGERLKRAILREEEQEFPGYAEVCRRFLADCEDFSDDKVKKAGIVRRFENIDLETCIQEILNYMDQWGDIAD